MNKHKNVRIFMILFFILVILAAIYFFMMLRFRGSVKVYPDKDISVTDNIILYRQDNSSWAADHLGDTSFIMKKSGCLVTCIASVLGITPKTLNKEFSENHVYDSEGNLLWNRISNVNDDYKVEVYSEVSEEILMNCLENGRFPIVRVRMHGFGNFHYVLIVKAEGGVFYCMDPLRDELAPLTVYGNRVYAVRCVYVESFGEIYGE